jgi:hypothetical protein
VQALLWLRIVPDAVFIGLGVVPLLAGLLIAARHARPAVPLELPLGAAAGGSSGAAFRPVREETPPVSAPTAVR